MFLLSFTTLHKTCICNCKFNIGRLYLLKNDNDPDKKHLTKAISFAAHTANDKPVANA